MRYEYFKIIDTTFVQSLLEGNLYMNTLNYFRKLEGAAQKEENKAQKDPMEGVCGTVPKNCLRQFGFHFSKDLLDVMGDHVPLLSDNYGYNNVFVSTGFRLTRMLKRFNGLADSWWTSMTRTESQRSWSVSETRRSF